MKKGFTLIELLVVIVIIAILAAVIFVALDPITRFKQARDAQRWNAVNNILTAVHEFIVDNDGDLPGNLATDTAETQLGKKVAATCGTLGGGDCGTVAACEDLEGVLAKYLASMPQDPSTGSGDETRYTVTVDANNLITIKSCDAEIDTISVAR